MLMLHCTGHFKIYKCTILSNVTPIVHRTGTQLQGHPVPDHMVAKLQNASMQDFQSTSLTYVQHMENVDT